MSVDGTAYEVEPDLAGETVLLLWGLFDSELYVEYEGNRTGPYHPISGPIPLGRYRAFKRGAAGERADRIRSLADQLKLPIAALAGEALRLAPLNLPSELPIQPFDAEVHEYHFASAIAAKLAIAIADDPARPLAKLAPADRAFIEQVLAETLNRTIVLAHVREYFRSKHARRHSGLRGKSCAHSVSSERGENDACRTFRVKVRGNRGYAVRSMLAIGITP